MQQTHPCIVKALSILITEGTKDKALSILITEGKWHSPLHTDNRG
jgi:hypothetical protein